MKYSVRYTRDFRHLKTIDEIILPYAGDADLCSFIEETFNKSQRIVVELAGSANLDSINPIIRKMIKDGWNIVIKISILDFKEINPIILQDIPYFFYEYPRNIEEVYDQAMHGASDVYITEFLGFCMKQLKSIKDKFGVQFRVIPNIAQCAPTARTYMSPLQKFWIRPEDTEIYEGYIDIFEIAGGEDNSRLSVVYEIYKQQQWLGNLNDLIMDFGDENTTDLIPNTGMNPHFAEMRLDCVKKCLTGSCNLCNEMGQLAREFNTVGIEVIKKRKVEQKTEEEKKAILERIRRADNGSGTTEETVLPE